MGCLLQGHRLREKIIAIKLSSIKSEMQKLTNIINWSVETSETVEKLFKNKATENSDFKT